MVIGKEGMGKKKKVVKYHTQNVTAAGWIAGEG